jgi:hypothetical protein
MKGEPMNRIDLAGRVAVVTGAARGIGRAIAERFSGSGAKVAIWDTAAAAAARSIENASYQIVDVTDAAAIATGLAALEERLGPPDILVNNAGISGPNFPLAEYPPEEWRRVIEIDLIGVFNCCRAFRRQGDLLADEWPPYFLGALGEAPHSLPIAGRNGLLGRHPRSANDRHIRQCQVLPRRALVDAAGWAEGDPRENRGKRSQQSKPADCLGGEELQKADTEIARRHRFGWSRDPGKVRTSGSERSGGEFGGHARADQKPCPRRTGLHDVRGPLYCSGADDNLRQLPCNRSNRSQRRRGSQRNLYQAQPAFEKGAGERHRIFLALDCEDRDDGDAAEQRMHGFHSGYGFTLSSGSSKFSRHGGPLHRLAQPIAMTRSW